MGSIIWSDVFPTKLTLCIFIGYMSLFISQGIINEIMNGDPLRNAFETSILLKSERMMFEEENFFFILQGF